MKRILTICLVLLAVFMTCCREKAKAVIFVKGQTVDITGRIEFSRGPSGELEPMLLSPGYIVIFRADATLGSASGKAGEAYRVQKDLSLKFIQKVNLASSNKEIAARFGIQTD